MDVCKSIQPDKVLEVGAGDGSILHFLNEWNFGKELYALEIADTGVSLIKSRNLSRLKEVQGFDGYKIPYADNEFDLVILAHVLEHVEHERILIRELKRVAKNLVIEVPLDYRFVVDNRMNISWIMAISICNATAIRFLLQSRAEIIEDKVSMTPTSTIKFNQFVNNKKPKTFSKVLRIELEYRIKKIFGNLLGTKKQEQYGNAYTVLTKKSSQTLQIF